MRTRGSATASTRRRSACCRPGRRWTRRPASAPGDRRDDRDGVALGHLGVELAEVADVLVVQVHVHEAVHPAVGRLQVGRGAGELADDVVDDLADRRALGGDLGRPPAFERMIVGRRTVTLTGSPREADLYGQELTPSSEICSSTTTPSVITYERTTGSARRDTSSHRHPPEERVAGLVDVGRRGIRRAIRNESSRAIANRLSVLLPALGLPIRPTSAMTFSSSTSSRRFAFAAGREIRAGRGWSSS